jgi:hypothetical protein
MLDLSHDLAAALPEREHLKTRTLTPAQLREKARVEWLDYRATGKAPEKDIGRDKSRERGADVAEDRDKDKNKGRAPGDDDFSM